MRRHPVGFWLITFLLAGVTASAVARGLDRAAAVERRWSPLVPVVVVARPVAPGGVVGRAAVRIALVPARLVPAGGVRSLASAVGRVALVGLWPGEVLLRQRVAPEGLRGVAALVPPGMRAVAVPVGDSSVAVDVGDTVDVLASVDTGPAVEVAVGALVVEVREGAVTLAVPAPAAARLASALTHTTLTLALSTGFSTRPVRVENGDESR